MRRIMTIAVTVSLGAGVLHAADWPQWQGPDRDRVSKGSRPAEGMAVGRPEGRVDGDGARIRLRVDGGRRHPIAAMVTLRSGAAAWCWKIAYDESYARYSPGRADPARTSPSGLLDDPSIARADSCATADHPMIDHIWRERLGIGGSF